MHRIPPELWKELRPEVQAIILAMEAEIAGLKRRVAELESKLNKTPQNSSLPPSSVHPHNRDKPATKPGSGRTRGGQKGHPKQERALVPPERCSAIIPLHPAECRRCGTELSGDDPNPLRHQVWEIPPAQPTITEYQQHRLTCPCCGISTCAQLPAGVPKGQSGPRLIALSALLMAFFRLSKRRTALALESIFNVPSSVGLMVKHQTAAADALTPAYQELKAALPQASSVHMDETGTKESNEKAWIWTAVTATFTLFVVRLTRAAEVAKELLGTGFEGVVITDRYAVYNCFNLRQLCWAHLLRDFQGLIDAGGEGERIGTQLLAIGKKVFHHWHRARDGTVTRRTMKANILALAGDMLEVLEEGLTCPHARTVTLCTSLLDRYDQMWTFVYHDGVAPTNNAAERSLRHAVIWRKLSFGTQSAGGSRFVETLLSVIETCRQQDRSVLEFVTTTIEARFQNQPGPSLLAGA